MEFLGLSSPSCTGATAIMLAEMLVGLVLAFGAWLLRLIKVMSADKSTQTNNDDEVAYIYSMYLFICISLSLPLFLYIYMYISLSFSLSLHLPIGLPPDPPTRLVQSVAHEFGLRTIC